MIFERDKAFSNGIEVKAVLQQETQNNGFLLLFACVPKAA